MARLLSALLVAGLLGGTAAAFAVTESLKLEKSPILRTVVDKVVSPDCDCDHQAATIAFTLRKADDVTVTILRDEHVVATVVDSQRFAKGRHALRWDGRDASGQVVADGVYKPQVHLGGAHRTIVLPNPILVDTVAPVLTVRRVYPRVVSPDGDRRKDAVRVVYRVSEPAHGVVYVDGRREVFGRGQRLEADLFWFGLRNGHAVRPGSYRVTVAAVDRAGNRSKPTAPVTVLVRYIELSRRTIEVRARTRFGVRVSTDARSFGWRFAGRSGAARPGLLVLRAPRPGRYHLFVDERGHADRALVIVRPRR
jgi:hypothetical protein